VNSRIIFWVLQIFKTKIGWLVLTLLLSIIFGVISNFYLWAERAMFVCLLYPFGLAQSMIVYPWVIKPIKKYFTKK